MPHMAGEAYDEALANNHEDAQEPPPASGWTSTKQAAKVLGVSRRMVQTYVRQGNLEARVEGEGVNKRFFVSIDSLNTLRDRRRREADEAAKFAEDTSYLRSAANPSENLGEGIRYMVERLEARVEEASRLRARLEITEEAQSTLEEQLAEERRLREEAERRVAELEWRLEERLETPQEAPVPPEVPDATPAPEGPQEATAAPQEPPEPVVLAQASSAGPSVGETPAPPEGEEEAEQERTAKQLETEELQEAEATAPLHIFDRAEDAVTVEHERIVPPAHARGSTAANAGPQRQSFFRRLFGR